jgi:putative ABC transport system permease protein
LNPDGVNFRKVLVTFQFTIIIALIASTGIIFKQNTFMQNKNLGLEMDDVIAIRGPLGAKYENMSSSFAQFHQEINTIPGITGMSVSHNIPGNQLELISLKRGEKNYPFGFYRNYGDLEYFNVFQIPFLARDTAIFPITEENRYVILNKMATEFLGYKRQRPPSIRN